MIAAYARELAAWKRQQRGQAQEQRRGEDAIGPEEKAALEDRDHSTDPADYARVPKRAYITIKTTKQTSDRSYDYYYWQWRERNVEQRVYRPRHLACVVLSSVGAAVGFRRRLDEDAGVFETG